MQFQEKFRLFMNVQSKQLYEKTTNECSINAKARHLVDKQSGETLLSEKTVVLIDNDNDDGDNGIDDDNNDDDDSTLGKLSQTPLLSPAKYIITITISKYIAKFIINHVNYDQIYCQTMPNMIIHNNYYQIYCKQILAKNTINQIIAK